MWFTAPSSKFPKVDRNKIIWRKFKQWNNSFVELLNLQLSQSCSDWKFLFGWIQLSGQAWIDQLNQERGESFFCRCCLICFQVFVIIIQTGKKLFRQYMCKLFRCSHYSMFSFISLKYSWNLQQSRVTSMEELDTADCLTKDLNKSKIFFFK